MSESNLIPCKTVLKPGIYYWCSCGHSKKMPWCDGAHTQEEGCGGPVEFEITAESDVALCGCGQTKNPPYCDGAHLK